MKAFRIVCMCMAYGGLAAASYILAQVALGFLVGAFSH